MNGILILTSTAIALLGLHLLHLLVRLLWLHDGMIEITTSVVATTIIALLAIGVAISTLWNRIGRRDVSDRELKAVTGGVVGCTFFTGLCLSGFCLPATFINTLVTFLLMMPVILGARFYGLFSGRKYEDNADE